MPVLQGSEAVLVFDTMKTVAAGLLFDGNRLLICQRSLAGDFPGKWELPGGKIEPGEDPAAALRRELQEELGITAKIGAELWRVEHQYPGRSPVRLIFYCVTGYRGSVQNRVFEQVCWVRLPDLPQYDFLEADLPLVRVLAAGELRVPCFRDANGE